MIDSGDSLLSRLAESGILSQDQVSQVHATLDSDAATCDGPELTGQLVDLEILTPYQAKTLCSAELGSLILGNYVILDLLGAGGMGHVYKARHREMDRIVAIKVLPPERVKSKSGLRRFQQEVKAAARLAHPNIVTAFDADVSGGVPYLVMECVPGQDLQAILSESGPLGFDAAIDYILQTACGLDCAHRVGVTHRDIKPANLLLDDDGVIRILDMGVAQIRDVASDCENEGDKDSILTRDGAVIGTADFMSPEQATNARNADARSDIYSLGCTLYFLLSNQPIYQGDNVVDRLLAHRDRPIPSLHKIRPDAPRQLDNVFARMVAKDPADRYQTAASLIADLQLVQQGHPPREAGRRSAVHKQKPDSHTESTRRVSLLSFLFVVFALAAGGAFAISIVEDYLPGEGTIELDVNEQDALIMVIDTKNRHVQQQERTSGNLMRIDLPKGEYQVQATKQGFDTVYLNVNVRLWRTKRRTIQLEPTPGNRGLIDGLIGDSPTIPGA